jgi:hypothetical protein
VFLETQNAGFVSNVTGILNALIQEENIEEDKVQIDINLFTTNINSGFEDEEISNQHLSNLQFSFATMSKTIDSETTNSFISKYRKTFNAMPNRRAIRGFDLTMDVVLRLVTSEDLYVSVNESPLTEYVETKFEYKKKLFGGYYNNTAYLLKYHDLRIEPIQQIEPIQE